MRSIAFVLIFPSGFLLAQSEFVVNSTLKGVQRDPQIARDGDGNYAVVWKSEGQVDSVSRGDIYARFFDAGDSPRTVEILVNTMTEGDQDKPAIAMNAKGDLVVAWASFTGIENMYDIKARIFRKLAPSGGEFLVNTTTVYTQTDPSVAVDDSGNFVIAWDSWYQDGGDKGVYGRQFSSLGQPLGSEFLVNQTTAYSQARPFLKFMRNGRFVATWESWKQDLATPSGYGLYGRIFLPNGSPAGNEFRINTYTNDFQWFGDLEVFSDNSFVVVWCSWEQDGDDGGIYQQRFDSTGAKTGSETRVNQTSTYYQWLPKVRKFDDLSYAVVWSSWKQDGDVEGVYARTFDAAGKPASFETQVNLYTHSFQWEPDFFTTDDKKIVAVWSSWGQTGKNNYDIVCRRLTTVLPQGFIKRSTVAHVAGRSTLSMTAHVVDSTALNNHMYEVGFDSIGVNAFAAWVRDMTSGDTVVGRYPLDSGKESFYLTPVFQGLAIEIVPEYTLELDPNSYFVNNTGSNLTFQQGLPTAGAPRLAPMDVALVWGSPDTLANGKYAQPLDTAINISGQRIVAVPFKAINLTDNQKVDLLVPEAPGLINQRFDPGERIIFLTPVAFRIQSNNTHAQLSTSAPEGNVILPSIWDTNYVLTKRPITKLDRFQFSASRSATVNVRAASPWDNMTFELLQNYPNPFNPSTTLRFSIPSEGRVSLRIYDIVGREVRTLIGNEERSSGTSRMLWDGKDSNGVPAASGTYFYVLRFGNLLKANRMILVK